MKRRELVVIFLGSDLSIYPLNEDLLYLILELADLAKYGRRCSSFCIYFSPSHKWQEKRGRKDDESASSPRGLNTL